jgi:hypothetical protein
VILLADRGFAAGALARQVSQTRAEFLVRVRTGRDAPGSREIETASLRTAIADAAGTVPGTDPDRASFTIALNTARDQVMLAAGVTAGPLTNDNKT